MCGVITGINHGTMAYRGSARSLPVSSNPVSDPPSGLSALECRCGAILLTVAKWRMIEGDTRRERRWVSLEKNR